MRASALTIALLCLIGQRLLAQAHVPFLGDPTRMWTSEYAGTIVPDCMHHWTTTHWIVGDSVVDGTSYTVIRNRTRYWLSTISAMNCTTSVETENAPLLVREEGQRVFGLAGPGQERLVYDFTVGVGDSVPYPSNFTGAGWPTDNMWPRVIGIDSVEIAGAYRKRFLVEDVTSAWEPASVIEGIGGSYGPFNPLVGQVGLSHGFRLICVREHGEVVFGENWCMVITDVPEMLPEVILAPFPNPALHEVTLDFRTSRFEVIDALGKSVYKGIGRNADLSLLAPGILCIQCWDVNGRLVGSWPVIHIGNR